MRPKKKAKKITAARATTSVKRTVLRSESHVRHIFVWSLVLVAFFGVLSILASAEPLVSSTAKTSTLNVGQPPAVKKLEDEVTFIATGDIMLARYTEQKMRRLKDYTFPFKNVSEFLKSADITFGNLESPFFPGLNTPAGSMTFRADVEAVEGLLYAGYDVVSLANNHSMNYRKAGLAKTTATLKKAGIEYAGVGENQDKAHTPKVLDVDGKKVAIYAYNDPSIPPGYDIYATPKSAGIAKMEVEAVKNDVKNALSYADFVVVSMHAGREYREGPTDFQRDFAHAAIDAGASAVIGTHPHVVQPVEYYGDGVIFYSLGNFVFDQFFSDDVQTGLVAKLVLKKNKKPGVELFPVRIDQTQPRILEGEEKDGVLGKLGLK